MNTLQDMEGEAGCKLEKRLIRDIESGALAHSAPILSTPKLAKLFDISVQTAQHVLQKLTRKGYLVRQRGKRTRVADRRKQQMTRTIGVITPNLSVDLTPFSSPFHYETLSGVWLGAESQGYDVKILNNRQFPGDLQHAETLGISGAIVLFPGSYARSVLEPLRAAGIPCVAVNLLDPDLISIAHCVNPDFKLVGEMAAEQLLKLGKKKIAFYAGCRLMPHEPRQRIFDACRAVLEEEGIIPRVVELPNPYDSRPEFQLPYRDHVVKQMEGIEAILPYHRFEHDLLGNWGLDAQILGGITISRNASVNAPAFFVDLNLIGRTAVERLATLLDAPETPVLELKIPPAFVQQGERADSAGSRVLKSTSLEKEEQQCV